MRIQVTLKDPLQSEDQTFDFESSPVRIGRSPHNEIILKDTFVSGCHGVLRFDETGTFYFDMGSRNGSSIDGQRVPSQIAVPLQGQTRLTIWAYELVITPNLPSLANSPVPASMDPMRMTLPLAHLAKSVSHGYPSHQRTPSSPQGFPVQPAPGAVNRPLSSPPSLTPPPPSTPLSPSTNRPSPSQPPEISDRLIRCLRLLDAFSQAFIHLKKGYEQFGTEIGVRPLRGNSPLHRFRSGEDLVGFFLDPKTDIESCIKDLHGIFKEMGIHDVALMEGVTQGVRGMLERLDPTAHNLKPGAGLWTSAATKETWAQYIEQFSVLIQEDEPLHQEIFGAEFARAYASVAHAEDNEFAFIPTKGEGKHHKR